MTADRQRQSTLISLQLHWGGMYEISVRGDRWIGVLAADPVVVLEVGSSGELRTRLEDDWAGRKQPIAGRWARNSSC
ncbi:MAG: hypothetical protein ABJB47_11545 [Actinomycetota bacterium]